MRLCCPLVVLSLKNISDEILVKIRKIYIKKRNIKKKRVFRTSFFAQSFNAEKNGPGQFDPVCLEKDRLKKKILFPTQICEIDEPHSTKLYQQLLKTKLVRGTIGKNEEANILIFPEN